MRYLQSTFVLFVLVFLSLLAGCSTPYVAEFDGEKITVPEFEREYLKNNSLKDSVKLNSVEERKKFLDLYLKFRMKVKEARALGYDSSPELKAELAEYRNSLAVSYMLDKEVTEPALQRLYQRRQKEVRASHILILVPKNPRPIDTLAAYIKARKIIDSLESGIPFETLALHNSQDPSVQYNRGDLYYFSAGRMVPEFEDAVYSLHVGEYTHLPVRSQFGYHIIKLTGEQPNQGPVRVAHIMKRLSPESTTEDSANAATQLLAIRDSILSGGSFEEFAKKYSDDGYSAQKGGELGFIDRNRTVREFDSAIFTMKDGEISPIVKTQFGLHLIKRFQAKGIAPYKEIEQDLKTEYQRTRFQHDYDGMVARIKERFHFKEDTTVFEQFVLESDTSKSTADSSWDSSYTAPLRSQVIFSYDGQTITVDSMIARVAVTPEVKNLRLNVPANFRTIADKIGNDLVVNQYASTMEKNIPDFAQTMKEYENGILLFKAEQENVWNKVVPTDSALRQYYAEHHSDYQWPDRINVQEIFVGSDSAAQFVKKMLTGYTRDSLVVKKTKRRTKTVQYDTIMIAVPPISFDSAAGTYNKRGGTIYKRGIWGLQPASTNALLRKCWTWNEADSLTYFPQDGGFSFVKILQKDPAREKTFEEAQSEVSGAYQEYETNRMENQWFENLKKKYPVVINSGVLETMTFPASDSPKQP